VNVADARLELEALLIAAGEKVVSPSGAMIPPQVFVTPASPFVEPSDLGRRARTVHYTVVRLVGLASDQATTYAVDAAAQELADAVFEAKPWTLGQVSAPSPYDVGGLVYLAVSATISRIVLEGV
jgi:predicted alternative tryptophan synthase beta-subunit